MLYTAIFKSNTIVADYSDKIGDFAKMISKILKVNKQPNEFYIVNYYNYDYYFLHWEKYTFSTITQCGKDNCKVLMFLQDIKEKYLNIIMRNEKENLLLTSVNILKEVMDSYKDKIEDNKISEIEKQLETILNEKKMLLEEVLEKDSILNNITKKSENLLMNVRICYNI